MQLAVQRGCRHYSFDHPPVEDPGLEVLPNEELAIVLLLSQNKYEPRTIRVAAQLIGGKCEAEKIVRLATMERCCAVVRYIAEQALRVEPESEYWQHLRQACPWKSIPEGVLPHWSRFVIQSGKIGPGRCSQPVRWLRPTTRPRDLKDYGS